MMDYHVILRRVGLAWIGFGLLDIGLMIYCLIQRQNYSSSFNLFAVILGLFYIEGAWEQQRWLHGSPRLC